ncbi:patatin-like phospholipase family protein [Sphingobium sp.]|uniref:patatin-like phospholipase family protein n=1 Tax=Sphingobium sp. TaxID=1912891 RepID=UPI002BBD0354|nr:patatin-like phospholipase family protein [Sphingobium sp.]HUD94541.1 patatin-like phospholipase family protein [Sphingobium sp.]
MLMPSTGTARWSLLASSLLALLPGCAQDVAFTPKDQMCRFERRVLAVNFPAVEDAMALSSDRRASPESDVARPPNRSTTIASDPVAAFPVGSLAADLQGRFARMPGGGRVGNKTTPAFLFLSGGSLHGAFGAGFLDQWKQVREAGTPARTLPEFDVVTGISTGAILSSFAFTGYTDKAVAGYSIQNEAELLTPYIKPSSSGGLGLNAGVALARKGAVADLSPLRTHLDKYLTHDVLARVADGYARNRTLWVGAVDLDTGEAVAFNMGDMAKRYIDAQPLPPGVAGLSVEARHHKDCYIAAILASSSAPIAAAPVSIDNRLYIDGGARFGLFGAEIGAIIQDRVARAALAREAKNRGENVQVPPVPISYAIVNNTLAIAPPGDCPKVDPALCTADNPTGGLEGAQELDLHRPGRAVGNHIVESGLPLLGRADWSEARQLRRLFQHRANQCRRTDPCLSSRRPQSRQR